MGVRLKDESVFIKIICIPQLNVSVFCPTRRAFRRNANARQTVNDKW